METLTETERYIWYERKRAITRQAYIIEAITNGKSFDEVCARFRTTPAYILECLAKYYTPAHRPMTLISNV